MFMTITKVKRPIKTTALRLWESGLLVNLVSTIAKIAQLVTVWCKAHKNITYTKFGNYKIVPRSTLATQAPSYCRPPVYYC